MSASRRKFLKTAAAVPAVAIVAGRAPFTVDGAIVHAQAPAAAQNDLAPQARALFDAMKAMNGRTYTSDEEQRVMRRLEGAVRQHRQLNTATLKNGDEPVTIFSAEDLRPNAAPPAPLRRVGGAPAAGGKR